jgi:nidogen (entactin)
MYEQVVFPNNPHQLVAPYWADADTRGSGNVWYFQSTESALLTKARKYIQRGFVAEQDFQPTHLFVATWEDVGYFSRNVDKV